ncbi:hypothetical protein GCM10022258_14740 [Aquimarina gracilis]
MIADSYHNDTFKKQVRGLIKNESGLVERKLIVYQISKTSYFLGVKDTDPIQSSKLYDRFNFDEKTFKVILIGLDGGIKKKFDSYVSARQIFETIDQMPMRKQELRSKND